MTLGEWLNRVILEDNDPSSPQWDDALEAFPGFGSEPGLSEDEDRLLRAMVNRLSERVESSEQMSARTLGGIDKAITQLAEKITRTSERTTSQLETARESIDRVKKAQDALGERVHSIETSGGRGASPETVKAVETTIMKLARRLYEHENDTAARVHEVGDDTKRLAEGLETRLARLENRAEDFSDLNKKREDRTSETLAGLHTSTEMLKARIEGSERVTNDAARLLETSFTRLDDRLRQLETRNSSDTVELERRFERLTDDVARTIADTRNQVSQALNKAAAEPRVDRLEDALAKALDRIDTAERRQGDNMARLGEEITKLAGAIDRRLTESERRSTQALRENQSEQKLDRRLDEVRQEHKDSMKRMGEEVTRLGRALGDRIVKSEQRASAVVETATDRMAQMMDRLEQSDREDTLDDRLRQSEERTAQRIEDALTGVKDRMSAVRAETEQALSPVQRAMSALADRLEAIEERGKEAGAKAEGDTKGKVDTPTAPKATPAAAAAAADEIDFDTPLSPPPQAETPSGGFQIDGDDPFLAEASPAAPLASKPAAQAAVAAAAPILREQTEPRPAPVAAPAPTQAAALARGPIQPPAQPVRPQRPGATADADFLAAARERTRVGMQGHPSDDGTRRSSQSGLGRSLLYALPVVALVMLSGAGALLIWEAWQGDGERVAADAAAERSFVAQVEADLSGTDAATTTSPATTPEPSGTPDPADTATASPPVDPGRSSAPAESRLAQASPEAGATRAPANQVADASGSSLPASSTGREATAPATSPRSPDAAPRNSTPDTRTGPARTTLESAAADGNPVARYQLGVRALDAGDAETAAILLRRAAEQGVPAAQYRYGKLLETGEGTEINLEDARRWTERAANAGHRRAMHNLGVMYYYGSGAAQNMETAARWFQEAALLGLRDSQFNLALLYETGDGVPLSLPDAYAWFTIAASDSDPTASERAATLAEMIEPAALQAARATAAGFTPRPIDAEANGLYSGLPWERVATTDMATVRRAQGFLSVLGYGPGPIDGEIGGRTRDAIMQFEADQGLPRTGRVDAVLVERLERAAAG
ncbi:peptidoglycan-binding protein [Maricaulis sp.]|uniref:peptidoglycan-binding protein n=1 Tax=Maricaulis sp. TaxID=1486257 RepID=UPI002B2796F5|nr:peptidoglycan-binding protein [Maricaulis sp.]